MRHRRELPLDPVADDSQSVSRKDWERQVRCLWPIRSRSHGNGYKGWIQKGVNAKAMQQACCVTDIAFAFLSWLVAWIGHSRPAAQSFASRWRVEELQTQELEIPDGKAMQVFRDRPVSTDRGCLASGVRPDGSRAVGLTVCVNRQALFIYFRIVQLAHSAAYSTETNRRRR
jgi:hypothetical protein